MDKPASPLLLIVDDSRMSRMLIRAIALDPMLIMYDEPFTGLDPIALGVIGQLIRRFAQRILGARRLS